MALSEAVFVAIAKYLRVVKPVIVWVIKRLPIIGPIVTLIMLFHEDLMLIFFPYLIPLNGTLAVSIIFASDSENGQKQLGGLSTGELAGIWILFSIMSFYIFGIFSNIYSIEDTGTNALTQTNMMVTVFLILLFQLLAAIGTLRKQEDIFTRLTKLRWFFYFIYLILSLMLWGYPVCEVLRINSSGLRLSNFLITSSPLMGLYLFSHVYILSIKIGINRAAE